MMNETVEVAMLVRMTEPDFIAKIAYRDQNFGQKGLMIIKQTHPFNCVLSTPSKTKSFLPVIAGSNTCANRCYSDSWGKNYGRH